MFVAMEVGSRRLLHANVTAHPTAESTLQQFRETLPGGHPYRFVVHDHGSVFSADLDAALTGFGVRALKTQFAAPRRTRFVNASSERFAVSASTTSSPLAKATSAESFENGQTTTTADARTAPWALAFRNRPKPRFQPAAIVTAFRAGIALLHDLFSEACTMNRGPEKEAA